METGISSEVSPLGPQTDSKLAELGILWVKEKGNFVAIKFNSVSAEKAAAAFTSPTTSVVDPELVAHLKNMKVGEAIELPTNETTLTARSLKVRVNKAAKVALRVLEWSEVTGGLIARVKEILTPASTNGTSAAPTPAPEAAGTRK